MNDSQCVIFRGISLSVEYHILSLLKGVACVLGALGVSLQWKHQGVRFLVHKNTKILFCFYFSLNIITSVMFASIHFLELIRLRYDCLLLDFRYILMTRGLGLCSVLASQHLILVLAFERLYSAIFPANFEKNSSKCLSLGLALTTIFASYFYSMLKLSDSFQLLHEPKIEVALMNANIAENTPGFKDLARTVAIVNCFSLIILFIDLHINILRKPVAGAPLAISYQRSENRRIVRILLPIEITQTLIGFATALTLIVYRKLVPNPSPIHQQLFVELVSIPTIFFPLILTFLIKRSVKMQSKKQVLNIPHANHFEILRQSWEN